jgi:hypothetical protein
LDERSIILIKAPTDYPINPMPILTSVLLHHMGQFMG